MGGFQDLEFLGFKGSLRAFSGASLPFHVSYTNAMFSSGISKSVPN